MCKFFGAYGAVLGSPEDETMTGIAPMHKELLVDEDGEEGRALCIKS